VCGTLKYKNGLGACISYIAADVTALNLVALKALTADADLIKSAYLI